jgi:hypothetical protein
LLHNWGSCLTGCGTGQGGFQRAWEGAARRRLLAIVRVHSLVRRVVKQEPTIDERASMNWWNSLTEAERTQALKAAGWRSGGTWTPSAADAWAHHKARASTPPFAKCATRGCRPTCCCGTKPRTANLSTRSRACGGNLSSNALTAAALAASRRTAPNGSAQCEWRVARPVKVPDGCAIRMTM